MQLCARTRSVAALMMVLSATDTALAGGRRAVVYYVTQPANRSFAPTQEYRHSDALAELQSRAASGSRGLQQSTLTEIESRLSRLEQRNDPSLVVSRGFRNDRPVGATRDFENDRSLAIVAAAQIAATVLGILQKIETSPSQQTGVQKADAIIEALIPVLGQINQLKPNGTGVPDTVPDGTVTVDTDVPPVEKLAKALATIEEALKEYKLDEAKQKQLREAAAKALKKVSDDLKDDKDPKEVKAPEAPGK